MTMLSYSVPVTLARWSRSRRFRLSKAGVVRLSAVALLCALSPGLRAASAAKGLAAAVEAYERKQFAAAAGSLQSLKLPKLADYIAYYRGAARAALNDHAAAAADFAAVRAFRPPSPLLGRAIVGEAQAFTAAGQAREAVRLLHDWYSELPQPDADLALATGYESLADNARAAEFYQRVYYNYPSGEPALKAASALLTLRAAMGNAYPPPPARQELDRVSKLVAAGEYVVARNALEDLAAKFAGDDRDLVRVRLAALDYHRGNLAAAYRALKALEVGSNDAGAEQLYYLAECARRSGDDEEMLEHLKRLGRKHPDSAWRLKALIAAGNRFLLENRQDRYEDLYKDAAEAFPETSQGAYAHWKFAWLSYLRRKGDAGDRLREHLERFGSYNATAAAYFLGRLAERNGKYGEAHAYYARLVERFPGFYYGVLARERLRNSRVLAASAAPKVMQYLRSLAAFREHEPPAAQPSSATRARIERARLLHAGGLQELAEAELRFASRSDGQPVFLAIEMARLAATPHEGLRGMKRLAPRYLGMNLDEAPKEFWRGMFPLPFRSSLVSSATRQGLDPFMVAALIRQESEFDPRARSRKNALGLTQVMPATGRSLYRRAGLRRYSTGSLYQPDANLRIGTYYLRGQLDKWGGNWERTLAAYNAGPSRAAGWIAWAEFEEPAEFIETIPFTETREYVQAVVRNAELYRQIYRDGIPASPRTAVAAAKRPVKKAPAKAASKPPAKGTAISRAKSARKGGG